MKRPRPTSLGEAVALDRQDERADKILAELKHKKKQNIFNPVKDLKITLRPIFG